LPLVLGYLKVVDGSTLSFFFFLLILGFITHYMMKLSVVFAIELVKVVGWGMTFFYLSNFSPMLFWYLGLLKEEGESI